MTETNLQLEDLFETKMCTFANINETQKIHENLKKHPGKNALVGFLVCLSVFDLVEFKQPCSGKRQGERFRDSGVKKVIIIGILPYIQENFPSVARDRHRNLQKRIHHCHRPKVV